MEVLLNSMSLSHEKRAEMYEIFKECLHPDPHRWPKIGSVMDLTTNALYGDDRQVPPATSYASQWSMDLVLYRLGLAGLQAPEDSIISSKAYHQFKLLRTKNKQT
jgi:hypothetical protein